MSGKDFSQYLDLEPLVCGQKETRSDLVIIVDSFTPLAALPCLPKRGEALILASRTFEKQPRDDNNMTSRLMGETFCISLPMGAS